MIDTLTHNNHLKFSVGGRLYGWRENPIEKFEVKLGAIDWDVYNKGTFTKETSRVARLIKKNLGKDLVVFLSGGTDSESVVRSFVSIGFKPQCAIVKFKNDYNILDVIEAEAICRELDVKLNIIEFDIEDFFYSGEAKEFGIKLQGTQIAYLAVYHNVIKLSCPSVMGGEVLLTRHVEQDRHFWYFHLRENEDGAAWRFNQLYKLPLVSEFFSYTPEVMLYYLEDPDIIKLVNSPNNYKLNSVSIKNSILQRHIPGLRVKKKTHGFENLQAFNISSYKELEHYQIKKLEVGIDGIEYNTAMSMLRGQYESN